MSLPWRPRIANEELRPDIEREAVLAECEHDARRATKWASELRTAQPRLLALLAEELLVRAARAFRSGSDAEAVALRTVAYEYQRWSGHLDGPEGGVV